MTAHQRKILDWINQYLAARGVSPSYQEIAEGCGMVHKSKAHAAVKLLIADGYLMQTKGRQRTLRLANPIKRIATEQLRHELISRGELYSPAIMACIKRAGLEAHL